MNQEFINRDPALDRESLASDLGLIGEAIVDTIRGLSVPSYMESRWSKLRYCGCSF